MKRLGFVLFGAIALGLCGAAAYISQPQAISAGSLKDLGFEEVEGTSGLIGGPSFFKVSAKTLKQLEDDMKAGKLIVVDATGAFKTSEPTK